MCIISNNIKFCTCVDSDIDIEELNHYWVLNRYNEHLEMEVMGEIKLPYNQLTTNFLENQIKISRVLETKDAFDKPITFIDKDRLQIYLNNHNESKDEVMEFDFEFESGKWVAIVEDDSFFVMKHYDEVDSSEVREIE